MEMYRQILALLEQADASNVIAALALVVATLSLLSSRRTSRRAVALAQQTIDLRGHLAGASLRIGREHWTVRVVNGTDPTVLDRVVLYIESREKPFPRTERLLVRLTMNPSSLRGVIGPLPPVSLTPSEKVEWTLPMFPSPWKPTGFDGCVHFWAKAEDALGRSVTSPELSVGVCDALRHSKFGSSGWNITLDDGVEPVLRMVPPGSPISDWVQRLRGTAAGGEPGGYPRPQ